MNNGRLQFFNLVKAMREAQRNTSLRALTKPYKRLAHLNVV